MIFILVVVIALVGWALHLMQEAIQHREFSLMLAGFLVSVAAAGMMTVYFLMGHYVGYMTQMAQRSYWSESGLESAEWSVPVDEWANTWADQLSAELYPQE